MKNIQFIIVTLVAILLTASSCREDYLDQIDPNGVSTDIYWENLDETEATLTSVYSGMLNFYVLNIPAESVRSDMGHPQSRRNLIGTNLPFYFQTFNNGKAEISDKWEACYQVAFRANQVIEALENLRGSVDEERLTLQMAQARFFRGLMHFYLHSTYNKGEIIIRDFVPQTNEDFNIPLSSSAEVIAFFREDLTYAYENLPASYTDANDKGRATAGAAATILGTSHLYQNEYTEAITFFRDVIENTAYGYELVRDFDLMFTEAGEFNSESILEINYTLDVQLEDSQFDEESFNTRMARYTAPASVGGGSPINFTAPAWITDAYQNEPLDTTDIRNQVVVSDDETRFRRVSLRAGSMIALVQDEDTEYYLQPNAAIAVTFNNNTCGYFKKYTNHDIVSTEFDTGLTPWKSGRNITINRLSDVYLMLAECYTQTGDVESALALINSIRGRWGLELLGQSDGSGSQFNNINYTAETLMEHIMFVERPLELSVEGHAIRAIDLRRWGIMAQRFQDLAQEEYYLERYNYVNTDGTDGNRNSSLLIRGESPDPDANPVVIEYNLAADNFVEDLHAYYPIPLSEIMNNSAVN